MIPWEDYVEHAPGVVGEQVHVDHTNCKAGVDTKGRLYVLRKTDELVLAYCHNCGDKGVYISGYSNVYSYRHHSDGGILVRGSKSAPKLTTPILPTTLEFNSLHWPIEAKAWAEHHCGLRTEDITEMGLCWDYTRERLLIPFSSLNQTTPSTVRLAGYQTRKIMAEDPRPKYLSHLNFKDDNATRFYVPFVKGTTDPKPSSCIVICEDMVSSYKLFKAGAIPYCLAGSYFNTVAFINAQEKLYPTVKCVMVWLDNDLPHIRGISKGIEGSLLMVYGSRIPVIRETGDEPKRSSIDHLRRYFSRYAP